MELDTTPKNTNNELKVSFQEVNTALSQYLRQIELHRTYYALKKISEDTN